MRTVLRLLTIVALLGGSASQAGEAPQSPEPVNDITASIRWGDSADSVTKKLGQPRERSVKLCNPPEKGSECWAYDVTHPTWTRYVVRIRNGLVEDSWWDHPAKQ